MPRTLLPGSTIGILGGGQLGRMISLAGIAMGYRFITLDPTVQSPSSEVAKQIVAEYNDVDAAHELAQASDVITYEFENVDAGVAEMLVKQSYVPQGSTLLYTTQHRLREKRAIEAAGVPVAPYRVIDGMDSLQHAIEELGYPSVLKTVTGGYDGKGQVVIRNVDQLEASYTELAAHGRELVLEQFIPFQCEVSVITARSPNGEVKSFPISENIHINNILHLSIVPARISTQVQNEARRLAEAVATSMGAVGLLAVEMFVTEDGTLYVNELAPRPHNSGHYTMEACMTSQFEQHVRAICNLPLGDTTLLTPVVMVNVLGQHMESVVQRVGELDQVAFELGIVPKLHLYGKTESKHNRKMGHINLLCKDVQDGLEWVEQTNIWRL
ncbi:5-(carboxyamino)imidazole ribonucleotide synthase [Paenibacillus crassostreae]|uniref:N5-carboxyaminoimidazole ribonucleotide synthase n=2 Tax=Paenibacillus crassostreae TaxID=1763538 RepID=A0A162RGR6_9BACL|nr:5-(carboxyamino)imidazole ribonucleotide synthase [Paenibacillus crassostreae]OAB71627.1 5-(carboxyamino)imidazole ribonucleotide synthase [Paenibacillus crassostreae]